MAEMVVKTQCRSSWRQASEALLSATFPLWGIASPIGVGILLCAVTIHYHQSKGAEALSYLALLALLLCLSTACLSAKRFLSRDFMIVDRLGIKLPRLLGRTINFNTYLGWKDIQRIQAVVKQDDVRRCRLAILKKRGKPLLLSPETLEPQFVEQFLLAAGMWAPDLCDASLESLQEVLRKKAITDSTHASYTALWEEELGRRFCPAAYITLEPGRVLRNCTLKVVSHLASGGLSSIYLCQLDGSKLVVLKESAIPDESAGAVKDKAAEMFQREADLLMKIDHPNIVRVLDHFTENGRNYMMMEYVTGLDLRQFVKQNGLPGESYVLEWAISLATTLKHLHEREKPIIHRDLTPDNIVLRNDGQVIIVDFGAANEFIGNATGTFVGKHSFIAPEQLRGKATVQSDIYAFGCTLYFLLTGEEPEALCQSNPRLVNPLVSEELAALIEMCTQLEVSDRYQNAAQLIPVLKGIAAQCVVL
jgi:predicted Ser/Thr protein kinase